MLNPVTNFSTAITNKFELIGPSDARRILSKIHPRQAGRHYKRTIEQYAHMYQSGVWDQNVVQTISISDQNELLDGFHRLMAVVQSGCTVRFLVARGVPTESFKNYDSGRSRSLAFRAGRDKDEVAMACVLLNICALGKKQNAVPTEEVELALDFIAPQMEQFALRTTSTRLRRVTTAAVRAACVLSMKYNRDDSIAELFHLLQKRDWADTPQVVITLYRRLTESNCRPMTAFALAWMAFDPDRRSLSKLQLNDLNAKLREVRNLVLYDLVLAIDPNDEQALAARQFLGLKP